MADPMLNRRHSSEVENSDSSSPESLITATAKDGGNVDCAGAIIDHIDIWTTAIERKSSAGRGTSKKFSLYGIKKLRELILELAVRGKLLPQDVNDEPASVLLERIAVEKAQLVKDKKIKKPKVLPEISDDEIPFDIPNNWAFVRLNNLGEWGAGSTPSRSSSELYGGDIPWFKSGELSQDYIYESEETVTELALKKSSLRYNNIGDVLLAMYGATIGKAAILGVRGTTNQAVCACTPFSGFSNIYLLMLLKAYRPRFIGMGAGGAQPNISREKIIATVIALPPLEEQHRIVAKVDELMSLCDALEAQTEASISAHQTLVETLLNALLLPNTTQPAVSPEPARNDSLIDSWQRVAEHFDTLFTTEASIDTLKQTILQLAVMGKLVEQDPNDEPAAKLLERIAKEKAQLIKDGKIKKQKPLPAITDEEKPFELPKGWEWSRIAEILKGDTQNGLSKKANENKDGIHLLRISAATTGDNFVINLDAHKLTTDITEAQKNTYSLELGDLLAVRFNGNKEFVGRVAAYLCDTTQQIVYPDKLIRMRFLNQFSNSLLLRYFINSQMIRDIVERYCSTTVGNWGISAKNLKTVPIPLPPLAEQHRIVAKVDELMAICDQLKARLSDAQTTQLQLTDAIVEQAI
jgi:type I restriction enzyme S subunit